MIKIINSENVTFDEDSENVRYDKPQNRLI